jgi:ribosomal-protein-alanine N-acetyltransferase
MDDLIEVASLPLPLLTPRLRLSQMAPGDADAYHALSSDEEVMRFLGGATKLSVECYRSSLGRKRVGIDVPIAVTLRATDAFIGRCGFTLNSFVEQWEVNVVLTRNSWGNGYASEVVLALVDLAFNSLGFATLIGVVHPENEASITILKKLGFALDPNVTCQQWNTITRFYSRERAKELIST